MSVLPSVCATFSYAPPKMQRENGSLLKQNFGGARFDAQHRRGRSVDLVLLSTRFSPGLAAESAKAHVASIFEDAHLGDSF